MEGEKERRSRRSQKGEVLYSRSRDVRIEMEIWSSILAYCDKLEALKVVAPAEAAEGLLYASRADTI